MPTEQAMRAAPVVRTMSKQLVLKGDRYEHWTDEEIAAAIDRETGLADLQRRYAELRHETEQLLSALTSRVAFPAGAYAAANLIDCTSAMLARHDEKLQEPTP